MWFGACGRIVRIAYLVVEARNSGALMAASRVMD